MTLCADEKVDREKDLEVVIISIEEKLKKFCETVEASDIIEIDTHYDDRDTFKIINHNLKDAYEIGIDVILKNDLMHVIRALETGIFNRVVAVSRIVGYYSRVNNWNASKVAELRDRRKGNYWEIKRINTETGIGIGEK